jgi:hypothetical protein
MTASASRLPSAFRAQAIEKKPIVEKCHMPSPVARDTPMDIFNLAATPRDGASGEKPREQPDLVSSRVGVVGILQHATHQ